MSTTEVKAFQRNMKNRLQFPGHDKATMARKSLDYENHLGGTVSGGKHNRCVILPVDVPMVADSLERRNQSWIARANSVIDLIIRVGDSSFHLHKLAMVSRSEYLNRLVFQRGSNRENAVKLQTVGSLVEGYLIHVARDENLTVESFKSLVDALPQNARYCDDNLYRAIDMYLEAHPDLTEEARIDVFRVLEYHRLSQEARQHVMKNHRLPLKLTTRFVLLEQVNMARPMTSNGSNYQRSNTQTTIRVSKGFEKRRINGQEIKMMRKDVEMVKSQLLELNTCKIKLQNQLKRCIR